MNDVENYMMQNRVQLGQIWQMLAKNMALAQSGSAPFINSTYAMPVGFNTPTMFSQIQGMVAENLGDGAGSLMSMLAAPGIRAMLPDIINQPISAMLSSAPIGGSSDPGAFMYAQIAKNLGRNIPRVSLPVSFDNRSAVDLYNEQQRALEEYAGRFNLAQIDVASPLEQLPVANANNPQMNLSKAVGFRNVLALRERERAFNRSFTLFNEMNIFGPRIDDAFLASPEFAELQQARTEAEAQQVLDKKVRMGGSDVEVRRVVESAMERGRMASGLISGAQMLSSFVGGNATQNAEINSLGDLISNALQLNENKNAFLMQGSQALGSVGNLGINSVAMDNGRQELIANRLTASIMDRINGSAPNANTQQFNPYQSMQKLGFGRSAELLTELSRGGMLSTGGVDIYGNMGVEEVKRMETSMMVQLEGFSEIARIAKRMGLKTQEVVQNLQGIYGGRATDALDQAASRAMDSLTAIGKDGMSQADAIIAAEEGRRTEVIRQRDQAAPPVKMGEEERRQFLQIEAQRRGGVEIMQQLGQAVELGRMAGIDTRGVLATATTANQILQTMGMNGAGSLTLTQEALSTVALSRNRGGTPVALGEAMAYEGTKMQRALQNSNARAVAVLRENIAQGILDANDPKVKDLLDKASRGENVDVAEVMGTLTSAGVSAAEAFNEPNVMAAMDRQAAAVSEYTDTSRATSIAGAVEDAALRVIGGPTDLPGLTDAASKAFGLAKDSSLVSVADSLVGRSQNEVDAELKAAVQAGTLSPQQANQLRQLRSTLLDSNLQGFAPGTSSNMIRAQIAKAAQFEQTGMTGPQIAAIAQNEVKQELAAKFESSLGNVQDAFAQGLRDTRNNMIDVEARRLAAQDPDKYGIRAPNKEALDRAAKELASDADFAALKDEEKDARIKSLASRYAEQEPAKYGEMKPTAEALKLARQKANDRMAASARDQASYEKELTDRLTDQDVAVLNDDQLIELAEIRGITPRRVASTALQSYSETLRPDANKAMPEEKARAAVAEEGVDVNDTYLQTEMFNAGDTEEFDKVTDSLENKALEAYRKAGLGEDEAFFAAHSASFSKEDVLAEIDALSTSDDVKQRMRSRLDSYEQRRVDSKKRGERRVRTDAQGRETDVELKALDMDSPDLGAIAMSSASADAADGPVDMEDLRARMQPNYMLRLVDRSKAMSESDAKASVALEGVDYREATLERDFTGRPRYAISAAIHQLRKKAFESYVAAGLTPEKAQFAALDSTFKKEDLIAALDALPDDVASKDVKAGAKEQIDANERSRVQSKQLGERRVDAAGNEIQRSAIDFNSPNVAPYKDLDTSSSKISANEAAEIAKNAKPEQVPAGMTYDQLMAESLKEVVASNPGKYLTSEQVPNAAAIEEASANVSKRGLSLVELLSSLSGQTRPGMEKAIGQMLAVTDEKLAALKDPSTKEQRAEKAVLELKRNQYSDAIRIIQLPEDQREAEIQRLAKEAGIEEEVKVEREKQAKLNPKASAAGATGAQSTTVAPTATGTAGISGTQPTATGTPGASGPQSTAIGAQPTAAAPIATGTAGTSGTQSTATGTAGISGTQSNATGAQSTAVASTAAGAVVNPLNTAGAKSDIGSATISATTGRTQETVANRQANPSDLTSTAPVAAVSNPSVDTTKDAAQAQANADHREKMGLRDQSMLVTVSLDRSVSDTLAGMQKTTDSLLAELQNFRSTVQNKIGA